MECAAFKSLQSTCSDTKSSRCCVARAEQFRKKKMETISRSWIAKNLEKYKELLNRRPAECPVCYESFAQREAASPLLSDIPSRCTHFLCRECWQKIATLDAECPICREDLRPWLVQESDNRLTNEEVLICLVSVMCIQRGGKPILDLSTMFHTSHKLHNHIFHEKRVLRAKQPIGRRQKNNT